MRVARLDTRELPAEQRYETWSELTASAYFALHMDSSHRADYLASIDMYDFDVAQVSRVVNPPTRTWRSARTIRAGDPEIVLISHVIEGSLVVERQGQQVIAGPGSMIAFDTSCPIMVESRGHTVETVLQFPTSMLGLDRHRLDRVFGRTMTAARGIGGLLGYIMTDLVRHGATHESAVVEQLATTAADLLGSAARLAGASANRTPALSREGIRRVAIYSYMSQRLADPTLTPESIARAHGLSVRQLDRILQVDGVSPSRWIRRQRLDRCRHDLADPEQRWTSVTAIGRRWGFPDPVGFNRAFQREFGMPPGEYRRIVLTRTDDR